MIDIDPVEFDLYDEVDRVAEYNDRVARDWKIIDETEVGSQNRLLKWDASSQRLPNLYCPIWNLDQMTTGKTHPTIETITILTTHPTLYVRLEILSIF